MKLRKVAGYPLTALNVFALVAWQLHQLVCKTTNLGKSVLDCKMIAQVA